MAARSGPEGGAAHRIRRGDAGARPGPPSAGGRRWDRRDRRGGGAGRAGGPGRARRGAAAAGRSSPVVAGHPRCGRGGRRGHDEPRLPRVLPAVLQPAGVVAAGGPRADRAHANARLSRRHGGRGDRLFREGAANAAAEPALVCPAQPELRGSRVAEGKHGRVVTDARSRLPAVLRRFRRDQC